MNDKKYPIDLVYLWVDGNDPVWAAKKAQVTGHIVDTNPENDAKGRYTDNNELKYALRSAEKHAPWIRKIFIITDNQQPAWLDTNHPKITIIDHKVILPEEALPCFNSSVIEYFLHRIPDLAEHFLFSNDDMFFNKDVSPSFFFGADGYPIVRLKKKFLGSMDQFLKKLIGKKLGQYAQMVVDSAKAVKKLTGKYYSAVPHHNIDSYRKSDYKQAVEQVFANEVKASQVHHTRTYGDLHRSAFGYLALGTNKAHLAYVKRTDTIRILVYGHNFKERLERYNPTLFCLNDNQKSTDENRKKIAPFLKEIFPEKSSFEK
jgi:hypothetical protein